MNDVVWNKKESIERCIRQIRIYYGEGGATPFETDFLRQDAIAINLQRICQQAIDLANHLIKTKKLGLPKVSRESFQLLAQNGIIPHELGAKMAKMVGFRNTLVHEYQSLDIQLMKDVVENHLDDLIDLTNFILQACSADDI